MSQNNMTATNEEFNWKNKLLLVGTLVGAAIGFGTAYLMARTAEETGQDGPPQIKTQDAMRAAVGIIGTVRGIAALGERP